MFKITIEATTGEDLITQVNEMAHLLNKASAELRHTSDPEPQAPLKKASRAKKITIQEKQQEGAAEPTIPEVLELLKTPKEKAKAALQVLVDANKTDLARAILNDQFNGLRFSELSMKEELLPAFILACEEAAKA